MQIEFFESPFPHVIIHEYYNEEELADIWQEFEFLSKNWKLKNPSYTGTSVDRGGNAMKKNLGIFLDELYNDRDISNILTCSRKLFQPALVRELSSYHYIFKYILLSNMDSTLVSYYGDGCYYRPHFDKSVISSITNFYKEPKKFEGGDLYFSDYDYRVPLENNRMIIFPSVIHHSVEEVKMTGEDILGDGRYTITQFLGVKI